MCRVFDEIVRLDRPWFRAIPKGGIVADGSILANFSFATLPAARG
jgi:hypothetical protein